MQLFILRVFLVLAVLGVGMSYLAGDPADPLFANYRLAAFLFCLGVGFIVLAVDIFIPQKSLTALAGVSFGLVMGICTAYAFSLLVNLMVQSFSPELQGAAVVGALKLLIGVITCYFAVSFTLQTKDDIRFIIPYIEFAKQTKGPHRMLLDTSVIIDGRIVDICDTRITDSQIVVPRFILRELQAIADSADKMKRTRGRRGLDVLNKLQSNRFVDVEIIDGDLTERESHEPVDQCLLTLAKKLDARIATTDYNLNKLAQVHGVEVINVNDLANALKPVFMPGENIQVKVLKAGEEAGQGVGYLDDGTMVVVEGGRDRIGEMILVSVTSVLQTSAGRMVFGRVDGGTPIPERRKPRVRSSANA